ncbi:EpsG family protein [Galbibacter sp. EGI 63066]|nr:EpsG family protein [Galbibacter sp. EGI 63066]
MGIVIFMVLHALFLDINDPKNLQFIKICGYFLLVFSVLFIGLRPVSGAYFGDMITYARYFDYYEQGGSVITEKDWLFHYFMKFSSYFVSQSAFFTICAALYIYPMYRLSRSISNIYWFFAFLLLLVSFSFWTYATNGIRNGIATSLFLLALSFRNKKVLMYAIFLVSYYVHQTLLLPILAFTLTFLTNNPKAYLIGWFAAIPLSIALGGFWENLFASMGFADDRLSGYLLGDANPESFKSIGFRWDFLIYSAFAVYAGWYFIFKKKFRDPFYLQLFNTYLIANSFWILVIRANFSNRFAYLSWFMMAIVIIYPFLKQTFFKHQYLIICKVILAYFFFTFLMAYLYVGIK